VYRYDADLITVGINHPNLSCAYVLIDIYTAALWFGVPVGAFYSYAVTSLTEMSIQKSKVQIKNIKGLARVTSARTLLKGTNKQPKCIYDTAKKFKKKIQEKTRNETKGPF